MPMTSNKVLLSVLALVACPAFEALLVTSQAEKLERVWPLSNSNEGITKEGNPTEGNAQETKPEKKMTDPITTMRAELCWGREKLVGHAACMEWLVEECTTTSFGSGLCKRVCNHVKEECIEGKDAKACDYAKRLGVDVDFDNDGVTDDKDAFPKDPKESKDTDGDGVGDNTDDYPSDPKCQKKPCPAPPSTQAPAPAPAIDEKEAPALAPATAEEKETPAPKPATKETRAALKEKTFAYKDPKAKDGLQSQGFSGKKVVHVDGETVVTDWGKEYGNHKGSPTKKSSSTRLWRPHALTLAAGALTLACAI